MRGNRPSRSRAPFYLLVLCIGLASIVYWQTGRPPSLPTNVAGTDGPPEAEPTGALQAEFTFPPLAEFSEIVARPLFSPSRQPPKEIEDSDSDTAVTPPPQPAHFILAGVVISAEERMVLLRRMNSTDVIRASMGQEIDGWYIELIEPDRVTLRRGNTVEIVTLQEKAEALPAQRRLRVMQNGQSGANQTGQ